MGRKARRDRIPVQSESGHNREKERCVGSIGEPLNWDGRGEEDEADNPEEMLEQIFREVLE